MTKERIHALWVPFWYGLDPYLEVDLLSNFELFISIPSWLQELLANQAILDVDEVFYCGPRDGGSAGAKEICARIASIKHDELGSIVRVDTEGLSYKIYLEDSTVVTIDAEERPGTIESQPARVVSNWVFHVVLEVDSRQLGS